MKVVIKKVGEQAQVAEIENTLEALQGIVEGYIEVVAVGGEVLMICNEEGKLNGLEYNFKLGNDFIVGNVLFVQAKDEDFTDLDESNIETVMKFFNKTPYTT